jgi:hypothetical protein
VKAKLAGSIAALLVLLPPVAASAEHLLMPYSCRLERGRVMLSPSPERSYPILGGRTERPFTWCAPDGGPCRIRMVQRFEINCAGARVPWLAVAAAAARERAQTLSVDGGRLRIAIRTSGELGEDCQQGRFQGPGCRTGRAALAFATLPPGFAPVHEVGARIVRQPLEQKPPMAPAIEVATRPAAAPATSSESRPVVAAAVAAEPAPQLRPPASTTQAAPAARPDTPPPIVLASAGEAAGVAAVHPTNPTVLTGWAASVQETTELPAVAPMPAPTTDGSLSRVLLVLLLGSVIAGAGMHRHRRRLAESAASGRSLSPRRNSALALDQDERACLDLGRTVEQLVRKADERIAELHAAAPLRGVLRQELDLIRLRLAESLKLTDRPKPNWRLLRTRLQAATRELHRIVRIADGAIASFAAAGAGLETPRSREEAYEVLGVNADVSEVVLKKVVDALRMSWHPDLAKDEADRVRREERTKTINVAWDLICGKRPEA